MFTGLITAIGRVREVSVTDAGRTFVIEAPYDGLQEGESIACDGACLTVRSHGPGWFSVAAVTTTLDRTTTGAWEAGRRVNLERALAVGDRLGGHIVQGHVDGVGTVRATRAAGDAWLIDLEVPPAVASLLVPLGSVAVDGVSLTVNALPAVGILQLSIIEHTMRHTTLGERQPGDRVHLEADILAKYLQRLAAPLLTS
ncbi:MAG: riboflavin synthase [Gemmatimonadota bacterium]|jgi:riboflavin synthase|nr:riboflavin synthase [Gemmatimonadota bacterium]MDQ8147151.1 riboflavin synthase [Gemmatimonadota bacterium]MDQ8149030.1 riboflavin synthase [Gemmatimonadota bacterium]MDQ8156483.1 riboflavin synthase [Gemmatimonadota bacterium]MDQ8176480.1 riboflavin synthase [Gemmatimonadota bacterium]